MTRRSSGARERDAPPTAQGLPGTRLPRGAALRPAPVEALGGWGVGLPAATRLGVNPPAHPEPRRASVPARLRRLHLRRHRGRSHRGGSTRRRTRGRQPAGPMPWVPCQEDLHRRGSGQGPEKAVERTGPPPGRGVTPDRLQGHCDLQDVQVANASGEGGTPRPRPTSAASQLRTNVRTGRRDLGVTVAIATVTRPRHASGGR